MSTNDKGIGLSDCWAFAQRAVAVIADRCMARGIVTQCTAPCFVIMGLTLFAPLIDGGTTQLPVMIIRLVLLSALGGWLLCGIHESVLTIPRAKVWYPVVTFAGLAGLSLIWSPYISVSLQWVISILLYIVFLGVVLRGTDSIHRIWGFLVLILAMGLLEGAAGIVQYLWLGESRAKGTFFNPNYFATYETVSAVLGLGLLFGGGGGRRTEKFLLALVVSVSAVAVILSQSRGGTAALLLAMTFAGFARYGKATLIVLLILVMSGIIIPNPLKERVMAVSKYDPYAYMRIDIWRNSLDRVADNPMGVGLGLYKYLSFQYRFPVEGAIVRYGKRAESAHNEYLQLAVELGVVGLAVFLVGLGVWAYDVKRLLGSRIPGREKGMVVGSCAGVLAILVHAGVDSVFHEPALVLLLVLQGGIVISLGRLLGHGQEGEWRYPVPYRPARVVLVAVAVVALAVLLARPAVSWLIVEQGNKVLKTSGNLAAIKWYRYASLIDPGTTAVRDGLARLYIQQFVNSGNPEWLGQAVSEMEVAMDLNPLDGRLPYRLGTIYVLSAEQQALAAHRDSLTTLAVQALEKSIKVDAFSPFGYFELSKIHREKGERSMARQLLEQAIAHEPNFIPARVALAEMAKEAGQKGIADQEEMAIKNIRSKYQGWLLSPLEQQFLGLPQRFN